MRILVVGIMRYAMAEEFMDDRKMFDGLEFTFIAEPKNPVDKNAVKVYYREKVVGYVAREQAEFVKMLISKYGYRKEFILGKSFVPDWKDFPSEKRSYVGCEIDITSLVEYKAASTRIAMLYKSAAEMDKRFDYLVLNE
jgi:hypothetical protein